MDKIFNISVLGATLATIVPWLASRAWQRAVVMKSGQRIRELQTLLQIRTTELQRESALRQIVESKMSEFVAEQQHLLRSLPDGFALADQVGNILEANDALCRMTGWSRGALLQMNLAQLEVSRSPEQWLPPRQAPPPGRREIRLGRQDGTALDVEWSVIPVPGLQRFLCFARELDPQNLSPLRRVLRLGAAPQLPAAAGQDVSRGPRMTAHAS